MSYILDALKKSEQQRNSLRAPAEAPTITAQAMPATAALKLPLILLAVALAAGWYFVRFQQPVKHQPRPVEKAADIITRHAARTSATRVPGNPNAAPSSRIEAEQPVASAYQPSRSKAMHSQARHQEQGIRNRAAETPVFKPITPVSPVSRVAGHLPDLPDLADKMTQPSPADANISALDELPLSVQQSIPPINIEGHIYDDNPARRMVIINGVIGKEKQRIGQRLRLEEITPNGVILSYQGHVFHLGVFER